MEEYTNYRHKVRRKPGMNPIWRGIGCLLVFVVPIITYKLTMIVVPLIIATGLVPQELLGRVHFPDWTYTMPTVNTVTSYLSSIDYFWVKLIGFFILFSAVTGVISFVYSIIYQLIGPPRYTVVDAPPAKYKPKVYKR